MQQTAEFARNLLEQAVGFELTGPHHHTREDRRFTVAWEAKGGRVPVVIAPPAPAEKGKAGDDMLSMDAKPMKKMGGGTAIQYASGGSVQCRGNGLARGKKTLIR